jgi:hypothetical protein
MKSIPVGRYAKRGEDVAHRRIARSCPRLARLVKDLWQALRIAHWHRLYPLQSDGRHLAASTLALPQTRANIQSGYPDGPCNQGRSFKPAPL